VNIAHTLFIFCVVAIVFVLLFFVVVFEEEIRQLSEGRKGAKSGKTRSRSNEEKEGWIGR